MSNTYTHIQSALHSKLEEKWVLTGKFMHEEREGWQVSRWVSSRVVLNHLTFMQWDWIPGQYLLCCMYIEGSG